MIGGGYLAAGALLLSVATGLTGYFHGVDTGEMRERKASQDAVDKANDQRDRLRAQIEKAALFHLQADQDRQVTHREIIRESTKFVDRPVYRNQCVDDDGVHALDRAADNANAGDTGSPAGETGKAAEGAA